MVWELGDNLLGNHGQYSVCSIYLKLGELRMTFEDEVEGRNMVDVSARVNEALLQGNDFGNIDINGGSWILLIPNNLWKY
jgi:hypothetical protein